MFVEVLEPNRTNILEEIETSATREGEDPQTPVRVSLDGTGEAVELRVKNEGTVCTGSL